MNCRGLTWLELYPSLWKGTQGYCWTTWHCFGRSFSVASMNRRSNLLLTFGRIYFLY